MSLVPSVEGKRLVLVTDLKELADSAAARNPDLQQLQKEAKQAQDDARQFSASQEQYSFWNYIGLGAFFVGGIMANIGFLGWFRQQRVHDLLALRDLLISSAPPNPPCDTKGGS